MIKTISTYKEKFDLERIQFISFMSFLLGFSGALLSYIASSYFQGIIGDNNVGIFFLSAYSIILVMLLNLHKLVNQFGKVFVYYLIFILRSITLLFLIFLEPSIISAFFFLGYLVLEVLGWVNIDIILESFSVDKMSGRIRGLYLTILNTGFILGPFISTLILNQFNYKGVFVAVFVVHCLVFSLSLLGLRGINHGVKRKEDVLELLKRVWRRKNILRIYYISFILEFFYAIMVIYTPIYLLQLGFDWGQIGIAFSIMLIPFVITQYPIGIIADKKTGEKELIILAILIMAFSVLAFYFTASNNIYVWAGILFMTRIGASMIEILRDSYFYKKVDADDVDLIDFFRTSRPVGYMIGTFFASIILIFVSMKFIFVVLVAVIFSALYPAFKLVDNKADVERL